MPRLTVWRCPECEREVEQTLFGTPHTSGLACIDCETSMEHISLEKSSYDYDDELVENDGHYEREPSEPETTEQEADLFGEDSPFEPVDEE